MKKSKLLVFICSFIFLSCKKDNIETFQPIFKYDINGITKNVSFKSDFLTNGFVNFRIEGFTLLALDMLSSDTSLRFGFRLTRPDPYWTYNLSAYNSSDSRAFIIMDLNDNPKTFYSGGGVIKLTKDETKNTQDGQLKIRSGTFDLTLYDNSSNEIQLKNGFFSLPYKDN